MNKKIMIIAVLGAIGVGSTVASANTGAYNAFNAHFNNPATCQSCHSGAPGTVYQLGIDWKAQGGTSQAGLPSQAAWTAFDAKYATQYGGVNPNWTFTAPEPLGTASVTGCVSSAMATPLMMFFGLLSLVFLVRRKKIG